MNQPDGAPAGKLLSPHLVRFVVVGVSNLVLSYSVFWLSLRVFAALALRGAVSQLVTYAVGTTWSYYWNRRWTFRSTQPALREASRFVTLQVVLAVTSTSLIGALVDWLHLHPSGCWLGVMAVITVANYALSKMWVFAPRDPASGDSSTSDPSIRDPSDRG